MRYNNNNNNFFRVIHLNWLAKFELRGPRVVNIVVNYCCSQKMLKELKLKIQIAFYNFVISLIGGPLGRPWLRLCTQTNFRKKKSNSYKFISDIAQFLKPKLLKQFLKLLKCTVDFNSFEAICFQSFKIMK